MTGYAGVDLIIERKPGESEITVSIEVGVMGGTRPGDRLALVPSEDGWKFTLLPGDRIFIPANALIDAASTNVHPVRNDADVSNVAALPGCRTPTSGPNGALISALRNALARAEAGELQSFIGTGFNADGTRLALWADLHENVYEMAGAITWLQAEYLHRHAEAKD